MSIDRQGKNTGETAPNKGNQRGGENKPTPVTEQINRTSGKVEKTLKKQCFVNGGGLALSARFLCLNGEN